MIGIVYTTSHGAGFSTENTLAMALDQEIARKVESGASSGEIFGLVAHRWPEAKLSGACDLEVRWVEEGTKFHIFHDDGCEHVITEHDMVSATI